MYMRPLICATLLAISAGSAHAQSPDPVSAVAEGLRPAYHVADTPTIRWPIEQRMDHYGVSGVSMAVLRDGKIIRALSFGVLQAGGGERVDSETAFSVGSLSKVGAAVIILRLVDAGLLDLDRDVNGYLKSWKIPANRYSQDRPVTLRGLLSHTGGANIRGFPDFQPGARLPSLRDTLEGRAPSLVGPVRIISSPGARANYSGGGVTIEQQIVEDVLGVDFETAARRYLFDPLGMTRSTYAQPLDPAFGNIAKAHDAAGKPAALPRGYEAMPETAASGLWTTPSDYARMVAALISSYRGEPNGFLSQPLARMMMTEVGPGPVGLGPFLGGRGTTRRFFHTGANDSYKAWMEGNLASGDGVIIFTNGAQGSKLYHEIRRAVAEAESWPTGQVVELPEIKLAPERLTALEGYYAIKPSLGVVDERMNIFPWPDKWQVSVREGKLLLSSLDGDEAVELIPADPSNFLYANDGDRWVEFVTGVSGAVEGAVFRNGLSAIEATRLAVGNP